MDATMTPVVKLSLAVLLGASITACSEQPETTAAPVVKEALVTKQVEESHEGHAHNEPVELTKAAIATADDLFQQDVHYRVLEETFTAEQNQVHEFFWYGCPACKATEPLMNELKASEHLQVEIKGSLINEKWVFDAMVFEAFKHFKVLDTAHSAYFEARQNGSLKDQASFNQFLAKQGIDSAKFQEYSQSDELKKALDASFLIESKLKSTGVPTLVVGGKYVILNRGFSNVADMQKAIEWLAKK
jgi:thiol:disulfide interchange protein DsbA